MSDTEIYICPCGGCIGGLKRQIGRAAPDEDIYWLRDSLDACLAERASNPRYGEDRPMTEVMIARRAKEDA